MNINNIEKASMLNKSIKALKDEKAKIIKAHEEEKIGLLIKTWGTGGTSYFCAKESEHFINKRAMVKTAERKYLKFIVLLIDEEIAAIEENIKEL